MTPSRDAAQSDHARPPAASHDRAALADVSPTPAASRDPDDSTLAARARRLKEYAAFVVVASLLALLPFSTCPVRLVFRIPCPGCGLTRATLALFRGDVRGSLAFHPLAMPLLAVAVVGLVVTLTARNATYQRFVNVTVRVVLVALVSVWLARFCGAFGGAVGG